MTETPAGWYPDPGTPYGRALRWWDGTQWTDHVSPAGPPQPYGGAQPATTPDGQPLSGWWRRVGAQVVDNLIMFPIALLLGLPLLMPAIDAFREEFRRVRDRIEVGGDPGDAFGAAFMADVGGNLVGFGLVALGVGLVYEVGFLRWRQATPGKMLLGLQVRLREQPGRMEWGTLLVRWLIKNLGNIASFVPLIGSLLSWFGVLDVLWPLWDSKKQALHDKAARTNVVRAPAGPPADSAA